VLHDPGTCPWRALVGLDRFRGCGLFDRCGFFEGGGSFEGGAFFEGGALFRGNHFSVLAGLPVYRFAVQSLDALFAG